MKLRFFIPTLMAVILFSLPAIAKKKSVKHDTINPSLLKSVKWRGIGPAMTSGRIADFAVNPNNPAEYYVAVASGNIWKTVNNGTTYEPIFDHYGAYSIGCLTMDPKNTNVVWAGTGERNHQRALGYGNGVYKTEDGGKTWKNMGLKESRQIGMIAIHPCNTDVVFVAAEGSVWGPGGDRGLYKTEDGGKTWKRVLKISENTGINNVVMMPGNPKVMFATAEQRRRRSFGKIGGGPESAVYRSTDGGENWDKVTNGIPSGWLGGMGIAISPVNPEYVYIIIEAEEGKGGFFRSTDRGASFKKMSDHYASGQYYNVIYCDPIDVNKVYSMETVSMYTEDGGKTWKSLSLTKRHVDDHAMWVDPKNTEHFMIGGDGGIYETYDFGKTYIYKSTLPVTQFYRVAVDNTKPFYYVYGGTQDNNSFGGPNAVISKDGATLSDYNVTLGGDGFWQAIDPKNPDIVYSEYQYGNVYRYDRKSKENLFIKPQPEENELTHRWNWDAPMFLSSHNNERLYIAANKVFRSDDRGNSWTRISEDLTRNEDRNKFKMMGKYWPSNAVSKDVSTSQWGTIVAMDESPVKEDLLYVGTDDGLVQITEDGGKTWRKADNFPLVPKYTYVSCVRADRFDENIVYVTFNNLKSDDFKPYVLKSTDKGRSWTSISSNLPKNGSVHTIIQDFKMPKLLFVGTEFNAFYSNDGGNHWVKLRNGIPDVAVRDFAIHEEECDLVAATFGRGFYIIDNYAALRDITPKMVKEKKAKLYEIPDALMYIQSSARYGEGSTVWHAPNPDFGAVFTYYIPEVPKTKKQIRLKKEKKLFKESKPIPQPTTEMLMEEKQEVAPYLIFEIKNKDGKVVRRMYKKPSKGLNKMVWDLTYARPSNTKVKTYNPISKDRKGFLALPGEYTVDMYMDHNGEIKHLAGPQSFRAQVLRNTTLPIEDRTKLVAFQDQVTDIYKDFMSLDSYLDKMEKDIINLRQAIQNSTNTPLEYGNKAKALNVELDAILFKLNGTPARASWEEVPPEKMPLSSRFQYVIRTHWMSTAAITQTEKEGVRVLKAGFNEVIKETKALKEKMDQLEKDLKSYNLSYPVQLPTIK
ncbi:MAG: YCF48-related protein [Hyphomicrobiales bacterium]